VAIGLMAYVPYNTILRGIVDVVQSYCNFCHAQTGSQMSRIDRELLHDVFAELLAHLWQLVNT
jgi:heterodisulfide reductase subunit B